MTDNVLKIFYVSCVKINLISFQNSIPEVTINQKLQNTQKKSQQSH